MKRLISAWILILSLVVVSPVYAAKHLSACSNRGAGTFRCHAHIVSDDGLSAKVSSQPEGFAPNDLLKAYSLNGKAQVGTTIAIVDAYDDPKIFDDLNFYSRTFHLPLMKPCTSSNSSTNCFQKIDQNGGKHFPTLDSGWASETSLDVEIAHAICQNCNILLVEAASANLPDLFKAFDTAVESGAKVISNSYGGAEFAGETSFDFHFNHPGVAITFSSGDSGYGVEYPASSKFVTAVGGTSLSLSSKGSYQSESAWVGAGSGCSKYESKPAWQKDTHCLNRTVADVSAVADPETGVAIYDSLPFQSQQGWMKIGGTSLASPIIAAAYALGKNSSGFANSWPYSHSKSLHDIAVGKNGQCRGTYLCDALHGYDGPTGLGSPKGLGAF
jgi:subtilase family serine protease